MMGALSDMVYNSGPLSNPSSVLQLRLFVKPDGYKLIWGWEDKGEWHDCDATSENLMEVLGGAIAAAKVSR